MSDSEDTDKTTMSGSTTATTMEIEHEAAKSDSDQKVKESVTRMSPASGSPRETPSSPPRVTALTCQVCRSNSSRYCCPRCQMRTCCLACVVRHKEDSGCSGLRDRAKFVSKAEFTDLDLLSDYRMLEEVNRGLENATRESEREALAETSKERRWHLPPSMLNLRLACRKPARSCRLLFMPKGFERRRENNSRFDFKTRSIVWRVRMVFPHCKRTVLLEEVDESTKVFRLFQEYVEPEKMKGVIKSEEEENRDLLAEDPFAQYRSNWPGGVMALLKAEHLSEKEARSMQEESQDGSGTNTKRVSRFFELDLMRSLRANLRERTVVEHPVIFIVLKSHADYFPADIELPKALEKDSKSEQRPTNESGGEDEKSDYRRNWDWSDYHNTTVSGKKGLHRQFDEVDEDEGAAGKTFGLFAENDSDLSEGEEWGEESHSERVKRRLDEEEDERRSLKRQRSREACQKILDNRRRAWRGVQARHEDASLVHAFAMQGEDGEVGDQVEQDKDGRQQQQQQAPTDEDYDKYYDFYLKYYQNQYGVTTSVAKEATEDASEETRQQENKGGGSEQASKTGGLVGYDESDDGE